MKNDIWELISDYISRTRYEKFVLCNNNFAEFKDDILRAQNELNNSELTESQKKIVYDLLKSNNELNDLGLEIIYKQAYKDCISLLRELSILKTE